MSATTWIGGVFNTTTISNATEPVVVSDTGQLGTIASSERFKKDIATMDRASEAILLLRPVTFHYKNDAKATAQFGLIAEEVAKVNPALVIRDNEGKPYTVRYDAGECDVAKRVPQRASKSAGTGSHNHSTKVYSGPATEGLSVQTRGAAKGNSSSHSKPDRAGGANPKSERKA